MSRSRVLLATLLAALAATLATASGAHAVRLSVGMGNEDPSMFTDPLFTSLKLRRVRYVTPWNTALSATPARASADTFLGAARGRYDVLVSFATASTQPTRPGPAPSSTAYGRAVRAFVARYPWVRTYSPWDEANTCSEPICRRPRAAAAYYRTLRAACPRCTVIAAEVLDTDYRGMRSYLQRFIAAVGRPTPRLWALHPYTDANRFRTIGTRTMLATVPGTVWMTEVGGLYSYGRSFPPSTSRQTRAVRWMIRLATSSPRIQRLSYYSFDGGGTFDAGLLWPSGATRPAYGVFARWVRSLR
ncbi:MAG TPA: glycosyl hydrolase [Conexibacter sp.]|nr:glycosyl hydrolase [Conexibacter sp.]